MAEEIKSSGDTISPSTHGTTAHMHSGSAPIVVPNQTKTNLEFAACLFQMIQVSGSVIVHLGRKLTTEMSFSVC
jgi:hypothetical protein